MIILKDFEYVKSSPAKLKQGVKGGYTPRGAVRGGNGSFIVMGDPPKVFFYYEEDGVSKKMNAYSIIKSSSSRRITQKYITDIFSVVETGSYCSLQELEAAIEAVCE